MLHLNKYLRELGIDENYWLFKDITKATDERYIPDEDGFIKAETFNLDATLSMIIYSYLCYFRDHCLVGYPGSMTFEQWKEIIDKMIEAFKLQIDLDKNMFIYDSHRGFKSAVTTTNENLTQPETQSNIIKIKGKIE